MNFLEALEANKTKRVRYQYLDSWVSWIDVGDLVKQNAYTNCCVHTDTWECEVVPQVLEFDKVVFEKEGKYSLPSIKAFEHHIDHDPEKLYNKKWRVRCEEIL